MIPIYRPYISKYKSSAIDTINSEWISNHGIYIELASNLLKEILGVKHCILMNNGTSSTLCLFKALRFKHPNISKIYVPNNVFVAPWNCALTEYDQSLLEVMKIDEDTFNIDVSEEYIMSLEHDAAVVIVHNLGNIVDVPRLKRMRPDLIFVEDNCEGLFGKYDRDSYSGSASSTLCSAVSFYGNKIITTGEGGAFFTNDDDIYRYIKSFYSHGMTTKRYIHDIIATNLRMTNVQAALLYDQLTDIDHILELKRKIYNNYLTMFSKVDGVKFIKSEPNTEHSTWMFSIIIDKENLSYSALEDFMRESNIDIRPVFYDIHRHDHLVDIYNPHGNSDHITSKALMLPSFPQLTKKEQKYIVLKIKEYIQNL